MSLARPDDREAVIALREAIDEPPQRHGDAVDFGRVGFGYEDKVQSVGPGGGHLPAVERKGSLAQPGGDPVSAG